MTLIQSILLGILQGLTEFLPISSSGHLVLLPYLLGWEIPENEAFAFDVLVQMGTLAAVIAYFWKDLLGIVQAFLKGLLQRTPFADPQARMGWYLVLATIPAGLIGLMIKSTVEDAFASPLATGLFLWGTAALLVVAEYAGSRTRRMEDINWKDAVFIGFFQVLSLFPGISRSGATITGGMLRSLDRPSAARFSFLMSIPVMVAAGGMALLDLFEIPGVWDLLPVYLVGILAAAVVGYLSIRWLLHYLTHRSLLVFAAYCFLLGLLTVVVWFIRG